MSLVRIVIRHKRGVFDPEGKVVESGLRRLGFEQVTQVRMGKVLDVYLDGAVEQIEAQVHQMCQQFLVNPVIEDYTFEIIEE